MLKAEIKFLRWDKHLSKVFMKVLEIGKIQRLHQNFSVLKFCFGDSIYVFKRRENIIFCGLPYSSLVTKEMRLEITTSIAK